MAIFSACYLNSRFINITVWEYKYCPAPSEIRQYQTQRGLFMKWRKVASGSFANIKYETKESGGEYLHLVTPGSLLDRDDRAPVYEATLNLTKSENYFCILDNRQGKESLLSMADMSYFGDILVERGIKRFFYAVVTYDPAYDNMIKLIKAIAATKDIEINAIATPDFESAEEFILSRMKNFVKDSS
jgi:hypothetical protein|tara:strand:+ start:18490 stop:19050 length:561 start_codon:yes stop_codon:yes gene_type:complete